MSKKKGNNRTVLLSSESVLAALAALDGRGDCAALVERFQVVYEVDSSNAFLFTLEPPRTGFTACFAHSQSDGRGRYGRTWVSPPGGVYLSIARAIRLGDRAHYGALGLCAASELAKDLCELGAGARVKPPNDVVCDSGKLAGVLVETDEKLCVLGIGLNAHRPAHAGDGFPAAAYLEDQVAELPATSVLVARVIRCAIQAFEEVSRGA